MSLWILREHEQWERTLVQLIVQSTKRYVYYARRLASPGRGHAFKIGYSCPRLVYRKMRYLAPVPVDVFRS